MMLDLFPECNVNLGNGVLLSVLGFWLGCSPATFYKLYSIEAVTLLLHRWVSFRRTKRHYYMFDFCYIVNILYLSFLWIWPSSLFLHKVVFAYSCGPLAASVLVFGNSLVYHDLEKMTSLFIHFYPVIVSWTTRWYPDTKNTTLDLLYGQTAGMTELFILPILPYIIWAVLYYVKIFVVSSDKIFEKQYETLYKYMLEDQNGLCSKIVTKFPDNARPVVYMMAHFMLVMISLIFSAVWWNSFVAHSLLVVTTMAVAMWNGGLSYLD